MRAPGGQTRLFAVLGHPVAHSLSPAMHNPALEALGIDGVYMAFDVPPDRVEGALSSFSTLNCGGLNVTVPLKEVAYDALSRLDDSARQLGAVNTIAFESEGMIGYNTDGVGFLRALDDAFGCDLKGARFFILGAGGSARAVATAAALKGAAEIVLTGRNEERTSQAAEAIRNVAGVSSSVEYRVGDASAWITACREADVVVQTTPVGMHAGDESLLPSEAFRDGQAAFDLIYTSDETPFMSAASQGGAKTANGLRMLLHQGARALEIWTGESAPVDVMAEALEAAVHVR